MDSVSGDGGVKIAWRTVLFPAGQMHQVNHPLQTIPPSSLPITVHYRVYQKQENGVLQVRMNPLKRVSWNSEIYCGFEQEYFGSHLPL